ncbi:MAG: hypothetical protein JF616_06740 [Fibrobacteres bacterium]|nr:hypothetical protein [Fibrobacterota bacterium]
MNPAARSQAGAALLTVLSALVALGIVVSLILGRMQGDIRPWAVEIEKTQALYLAESGIAYQLYLERWSDSSEPSFGPPASSDSSHPDSGSGFGEPGGKGLGRMAPTDTFAFRFDTALGIPEVSVNRSRAYLDMTATGKYRAAEATVHARFGKALDDSIFGPALTLDNDLVVEPFPKEQVNGMMRIRKPSPGMATLPFLKGFSLTRYAGEFTDKKYFVSDEALRNHLADSVATRGNGHFTPRDPPKFGKKGFISYSMGQVDLINDGMDTWVIKGPGRIYCDGEIRLKGKIRLQDIGLYSGKDITFEEEVSGNEVTAFARGGVFLHGHCRLGIDIVATKDIVLRDQSETLAGSVLLSTGSKGPAAGVDTINAIRVVNEAVARGFLIAAGPSGRVVMATPQNRVEGVILASSAWLTGEVDGPVLTGKLLCEGTNNRNCMGPARIYRDRLPADFTQPLQLGPQDRRAYAFKLMDWRQD